MNKTKITKNKKISFTFILKLTKTIIYTMLVFCILLIILYVIGNYQNFQDKSQQFILDTLSYSSICTLFLTVPVLIESFIRLFTVKKKADSIITIINMIFSIVLMLLCMSFSSAVGFLSEGLAQIFTEVF